MASKSRKKCLFCKNMVKNDPKISVCSSCKKVAQEIIDKYEEPWEEDDS